MRWARFVPVWLLGAACVFAATPLEQAKAAYNRTDYDSALRTLNALPSKDGAAWALIGMSYFGQADYKKAGEAFEKAVAADPNNSDYVLWLGRAWGRRAESASPFMAPTYASRARTQFEKSVTLNPSNKEALNDLFDYYLNAPGFLGGGFDRAQALVDKIAKLDAAEGHYARAQLADRRKQFDEAEQQLRRALEVAPRQVGRVIDLAKYLSKRGRVQESETVFAQAERLAPDNPRLLFERAETYIREKRNLDQAKVLLRKYLSSTLGPDDPPRDRAEELLRRAGA